MDFVPFLLIGWTSTIFGLTLFWVNFVWDETRFPFLWHTNYREPSGEFHRVPQIHGTEDVKVLDNYAIGTPVVLKDRLGDTLAKKNWNPDYFASNFGDYLVQTDDVIVEQQDTESTDFSVTQYVKWMQDQANNSTERGEADRPPKYWSEDDRFFWKYPSLSSDLPMLSQIAENYVGVDIYFWMGPNGTRTGLHVDPDSFHLLFHVYGTKNVTLYPPSNWKYLYPGDKWDRGGIVSRVDAFNPQNFHSQNQKFPLFSKVSPVSVILEAGDILLIPPGWWHQVEALAESISLAAAFMSVTHEVQWLPLYILDWLHHRGLYKKHHCTCHEKDGNDYLPFSIRELIEGIFKSSWFYMKSIFTK